MNKFVLWFKAKLKIIDEHFTFNYLLSILKTSLILLFLIRLLYEAPFISKDEFFFFFSLQLLLGLFLGAFSINFPKQSLWHKLTKKESEEK